MDFNLLIRATTKDQFLLRLNVFNAPLTPFFIPGVFNFGPEVRIDAGLSYDTTDDIELKFGFDFDVPFNFRMDSPKGKITSI
jgi:hypothetical protein